MVNAIKTEIPRLSHELEVDAQLQELWWINWGNTSQLLWKYTDELLQAEIYRNTHVISSWSPQMNRIAIIGDCIDYLRRLQSQLWERGWFDIYYPFLCKRYGVLRGIWKVTTTQELLHALSSLDISGFDGSMVRQVGEIILELSAFSSSSIVNECTPICVLWLTDRSAIKSGTDGFLEIQKIVVWYLTELRIPKTLESLASIWRNIVFMWIKMSTIQANLQMERLSWDD